MEQYTYYEKQIPINNLKRDMAYSRPLDKHWVNQIIKNYDPALTKQLIVSKRDTGELYLIDGNHTVASTLEVLGDTAVLSAKIYLGLTVAQEAELFYKHNSNSKKPTYNDKLRARVASNSEDALNYIDAINESGINWGYQTSGHTKRFVAHAGGERCLRLYGKDTLIQSLIILRDSNNGELYTGQILGGICYLVKHTTIDKKELSRKLMVTTKSIIRQHVNRYGDPAHEAVDSSNRIFAKGILDIYNSGKRSKRVKMKEN